MKLTKYQTLALALLAIAWLSKHGGVAPLASIDQCCIIYETGESALRPHVVAAVREIANSGIDVYMGDDDVVTGDGDVPERLAKAIEAARANGMPALVLLANGEVRQAMDLPESKEAILEAVK